MTMNVHRVMRVLTAIMASTVGCRAPLTNGQRLAERSSCTERGRDSTTGLGIIALSSISWTLVGVVLALTVAVVLDFANVPFVPGTRRSFGVFP
jgi:hypothetical protein